MHYAIVIPVKTKEAAYRLLAAIVGSGLGAMIEERGDDTRCKGCQHKSTPSVTVLASRKGVSHDTAARDIDR